MLRPEVLDAQGYPQIALRAAAVAGSLQAPRITARITIRNATRDVEVPTKLSVEGERLTASGEFDIQQTDFGIKPFSVAFGALEVQDRLHITFHVVAGKEQIEITAKNGKSDARKPKSGRFRPGLFRLLDLVAFAISAFYAVTPLLSSRRQSHSPAPSHRTRRAAP